MLLLQWVRSLCQPLYPLSSSKSSCYYYSGLEACVTPCIRCLHPSLHGTITVSWKLVSALVSVVYPLSSSKSSWYYHSELEACVSPCIRFLHPSIHGTIIVSWKLISPLVYVVFIQVFIVLLQWVGSLCQPLYPLSSSKSSCYYYSELEAFVTPCIRCLHPSLHATITVSWKLVSALVSVVFIQVFVATITVSWKLVSALVSVVSIQVFMLLLQWVGSLCQPLYPLSSSKSSWYYYSELEACVSPCIRCLHPSLRSYYYSELEACVSPCIRCLHPSLHATITVSWKLVSALVSVVFIQVFMVLL